MGAEDIELTDWQGILIGDVPGSFYLEEIFRAAFVYLVLMVSMRLIGRRMASQLNRTEMAAMVSLAAAVGIPLLSPDRGLLAAVVIAVVIVSINRLIARLSVDKQRAEEIFDGTLSVLVENFVLRLPAMKKTRITRERLFAQLRSKSIAHLGKVRRVYLEANGTFSIVPETNHKPGLSLLPGFDQEFIQEQKRSPNVFVCERCGNQRASLTQSAPCPNCANTHWVAAVE